MPRATNIFDRFRAFSRVGLPYGEAPVVFNALDYGADNTGSTDSTEAIQDAIDAAAIVGGNVYLPAGTYDVDLASGQSYSLALASNVRVYGDGPDSTIVNFATQSVASDVFYFSGVEFAEVAEMTVTTPDPGNLDTVASTSWYPCAFKFLGSDDCKLTNVRAEHMRQGIKVGSGVTCNRLTVSGYETHDCITAIFTANLSVASFTGCTCQVITNNTIQNHTLYAERECHNVTFTNCALSGAGGYVAHLYMEGAYTSSYFTFDNCSFIGPRYGVRLDSQFDHVTFTNGCVFQAGSSDGVFLVESCTNVLVEDFTATGTGYIVYNLAGSTPSNVVFKDGTWFGNALEVGGSREGVTYDNVVEGHVMDITFVGGASAYSATDPVTVAAIAGLQDGDVLLACDLTANNSTYTVTWPARFTEIASSGQSSRHSRIAWKRFSTAAGDSTEDTYPFEVSDLGTARSVSILVFRGCKATGDPFAHVSNTQYVTSDATVRAAGFTTAVEAALVWWGAFYSDASLSAAPSGFSSGASNPSSSYQVHSYYKLGQAAGATGDIDGTLSAAVTAKHAFMLDLIPEVY